MSQDPLPSDLGRDYVALLDLGLEAIAFGDLEVARRRAGSLQALSSRLAESAMGARDVIELHVLSMKTALASCSQARGHALQGEGRLQVLELMGHLADTYRVRGQAPVVPVQAGTERQRHALGLNDTVLQKLVAAQTHLELKNEAAAADALSAALANARHLLADLLGDAPVLPGDLSRPVGLGGTTTRLSGDSSRDDQVSVLIADDDATMRGLLTLLLEDSGGFHVVGEVSDTARAVTLTRELQPELVLLDVSMPGADGLTAVPLLAAAATETCIVVVSGFSAEQMAPTARAQGAHGYLEKADLGRTLIPAVQAALALRQQPEVGTVGY